MKELYEQITYFLKEYLGEYNLNPPLVEIPKDKSFGDFSVNAALKLASLLRRDPLSIAAEIKEEIEECSRKKKLGISKIEIARPGFVNIFVSEKNILRSFNALIKDGKKFFQLKKKEKIIVEFVSANPTGPLSIAHGRQAVVGDIICRLREFCGNTVIREYYLNDDGRQIDLLVASVKERIKQLKGKPYQIPEGGYQGEYLIDIAKSLASAPADGNFRALVLEQMINLIKKDLSSAGVTFNSWVSQAELTAKGKVSAVIRLLKKRGFIYEKDGAVWFRSSRFGDDKDRVLIKKDGALTYFAADIAYHQNKFLRKPKELINLWGPDHHGYIPRIKSAASALGFDAQKLKVIIIQLVKVSSGRMSRRKGTVILLRQLIEEIGKDAARFYYILRKNSSHLEVDIELAKKESFDNPLYYIQYAHARIMSIFKKAKVKQFSARFNRYAGKDDLDLLREVLKFGYVLDNVYYSLEPVLIVEYLKSLAASFHKYYEKNRVITENKEETAARLNLLFAVKTVFALGLEILGIKAAEKM